MLEARLMVENRLGLHARAAAQLVKLTSEFRSDVTLIREDNSAIADAKSILSILTISASIGTPLVIQAHGDDEKKAIEAVVNIFSQKFGES
jgi:phosphocarrier protein HPr